MKKSKLAGRVIAAAVILAFIGTMINGMPTLVGKVEASPVTIYVPDDYSTIQAAVDACSSGDTIIVRHGTYTENVVVDKSITLSGEGTPTIDGGNTDFGIRLLPTANNCTIEGFILTGNGERGCWIDMYSDYNTIQNNVCSGGIGLSLTANGHGAGSMQSLIIGNEFGRGVFLFGEGEEGAEPPVELFSSHTIENNTINGKPIYYYSNTEGITVPQDAGQVLAANCSNIVVEGMECPGATVGIELAYVTDSIISENNCLNCDGAGVALFFSSNNTLISNEVESSVNGIYLMFSDNNILEGNVVTGGTVEDNQCGGICLFAANTGNVIMDNTSSDNKGCGVCIRWMGNSNNVVVANTIRNNEWGIYLGCQDTNTIYLNDFVDNASNVYCYYNSTNIWHSPEEITYTYDGDTYTSFLGNYWDDYAGSDADGDGIGETPYPIDSDADNHPLVEPSENYVIGEGPSPFCFIATAAYGTPMAGEVQTLRDFRDEYLITTPLGHAFVNLYYKLSPPIAEFITDHPSLKPVVRDGLLPAVVVSTLVVNSTPAEKAVALVVLLLVSVAIAIWAIRRRGRDPEYN